MISREFLTAGKATFTIECPGSFVQAQGSKPHYTFRVRFKKGTNGYSDTYFVDLLTGPDNTSSYTYLGIIRKDGTFTMTAKSKLPANSTVCLLLARVVKRVWDGEGEKVEAAGFKVHHEGMCGRCGRLLTVPESVETGIGPECGKRMVKDRGVSFELSERPGFDLEGFTPHRDQEGELTHWTGSMAGTRVTVFND